MFRQILINDTLQNGKGGRKTKLTARKSIKEAKVNIGL